jgi:hypothetical protein
MKKLVLPLFVLTLATLVLTPSVQAQEDAAEMAYTVTLEPVTGHAAAMEEGAKRHMEWYEEAGGEWSWAVFEIGMGARTGQYVWFSGGHTYASFDEPDVDQQESNESIERNFSPHVENAVISLARQRTDLSMRPADAALRPIYEVLTFSLTPGSEPAFIHFLEKIKSALESVEAPFEYTVYQSAQGGNGDWVISLPHESFGSMGGGGDFEDLFEQAFGKYEARGLLDGLGDAVASVSSEIFFLRRDLSLNIGM